MNYFACNRLENTHSEVQQTSSLQFNPKQRPDLFWDHATQKHSAYFEPGLRAAIAEDVDEALGKAATSCITIPGVGSAPGDGSGSGTSTSDVLSPAGSATSATFTLPSDNQDRKLIGQVMKISTWEIQQGESYRCGFCS